MTDWFDRVEATIADHIVRRSTLLFLLGLAITAASLTGFTQAKLRNDYRSFFEAGDPVLERTDWLSSRMGDARETATVIYVPADGDATSSLSILQYRQLQRSARQLPFVVKTRSWFDMDKVIELPDGAGGRRHASVPFAQGADLYSPEGLAIFKADMAAAPHIHGRYIARDSSSAVVMLLIDLETAPGSRLAKLEQLEAGVRGIERELRQISPDDRLYLVGSTLFDYASTTVLRHDARQLFPVAAALFAVALFLLYRSPAFTLMGMVLIVLPVIATAGIASALGWEFSTLVVSGLLLVGTLAVADILHVANSYFLIGADIQDRREALRQALAKNFWAISATSTTTFIGELALLFSSSPPVRVMGMVVMVGVFLAWLLCVLMLPACLLLLRPTRNTGASWMVRPLARLSLFSARNPWPVMVLFAAMIGVTSLGLTQSRIDDSMSGWFSEDTEFRQGMDIIDRSYFSLRTLTLALELKDTDVEEARNLPALGSGLSQLKDLQTELEAGAGTWLTPFTLLDAFATRLAQTGPTGFRPDPAMVQADPSPLSPRTLSEAGLLTQYEPGKTDFLVHYFDPAGISTFSLLASAQAVEARTREIAPDRQPQVQGIALAFAQLSTSNFFGMLQGSLLVLAIVTASLAVVFRSLRLCLLSLLPNVAPVLMIYGLWGFWDGRINMAAVSVFSVACGIVVDDTIHFVLSFQRYYRQTRDSMAAIAGSVSHSGSGVLATTLLVGGGFFILGQTDFELTAQKANMVGASIILAFIIDLMVLPALLRLSHPGTQSTMGATLPELPERPDPGIRKWG